MPVELKTYPDPSKHALNMRRRRLCARQGYPLLVSNCSGRSGALRGIRLRGPGRGPSATSCRLWYWTVCDSKFTSSTADLWGQVAAGPSGHDHHQREEALTPMSPQWPQRTSEAHQGSPDRPPASYTAPEASPTGCSLASAAPLVCPQDQKMQDRGSGIPV